MTPLEACRAGLISPEVAVARLLLAGADVAGIEAALAGEGGAAAAAMRGLVAGREAALAGLAGEVRATGGQHDASGMGGVARIAAFFDRAVRHSPEASVALYSLGDAGILAAATGEIVGWLEAEGLLGAGMDVLDLGCGIGRVMAAVAPRCRSVVGLDVSEGMVAEAGRRLAGVGNAVVRRTAGVGLEVEAGSLDLVLAVDSFPYLVQAGVAGAHVAGAARALRVGGALCVLNLSYRDDPAADVRDAAAWGAESGMRVERCGGAPFRLWDGTAFVWRR